MESRTIMGIVAGILIGLLIIVFFIFEVLKDEPEQNQFEGELFIGNITNFYHIYFECEDYLDEYIIGFGFDNESIKLNGTELCEVVKNQGLTNGK